MFSGRDTTRGSTLRSVLLAFAIWKTAPVLSLFVNELVVVDGFRVSAHARLDSRHRRIVSRAEGLQSVRRRRPTQMRPTHRRSEQNTTTRAFTNVLCGSSSVISVKNARKPNMMPKTNAIRFAMFSRLQSAVGTFVESRKTHAIAVAIACDAVCNFSFLWDTQLCSQYLIARLRLRV